MTEELEQLLTSLHLKRIARDLRRAAPQGLREGGRDLLGLPARAPAGPVARPGRRAPSTWRIKRARLPEQWSLETFPYAKQPGVNRRQIRAFAELDFIAKAENIVFIGPTGVGKTGLASGLLLKALQNGYRGAIHPGPGPLRRDVRLPRRPLHPQARQPPRAPRRPAHRRARLSQLPPRADQHLLQAHGGAVPHAKPRLITTNLQYDEWHGFLGNKPMVDALLSRLRHRCHTVNIDGPSLRDPQG